MIRRLLDRLPATGDRLAARGLRFLQGGAARFAWRAAAVVAAVPLLALGTVQVASLVAHEEVTLVTEVDADELAGLQIANEAGSTRVVGVDGADSVTVEARVSHGLRPTGHEVVERDGWLVARGTCPVIGSAWCRVDYMVEVPAGLTVRVSGRGAATLSDLTGTTVVDVHQGSVDLERVGGDVRVSASQGSVDGTDLVADRVEARASHGSVDLDFARSPVAIEARADRGSIDIVVPDEPGVAYATQTQADQGSVSDDGIRTDPRSDRSIVAEADRGSVVIAYAPA